MQTKISQNYVTYKRPRRPLLAVQAQDPCSPSLHPLHSRSGYGVCGPLISVASTGNACNLASRLPVGSRLSMYVSLLLRLARIYTHSTTSTHSLTPRPVPRLTADSIHALDQPFLQFVPHLHPQSLERSTFASTSRGEDSLHKGSCSCTGLVLRRLAGAENPTKFFRRGGAISFPLNIAKILSRYR